MPVSMRKMDTPKPTGYRAVVSSLRNIGGSRLTSLLAEVDVGAEDTAGLGEDRSEGERGGALGLPRAIKRDPGGDVGSEAVEATCGDDDADVCDECGPWLGLSGLALTA